MNVDGTQQVSATVTAALHAATSGVEVWASVCGRAGSGPVAPLAPEAYVVYTSPGAGRGAYPASATTVTPPAAGTLTVGYCLRNDTAGTWLGSAGSRVSGTVVVG